MKVSEIPSYGKPPGSMKTLMRHATSLLLWGRFHVLCFSNFHIRLIHESCKVERNTPIA